MKNRTDGVVMVKIIAGLSVMILGVLGTIRTERAVEATREVKACEAKLPADFAACKHPIKLSDTLYYISETAATPTLYAPLKELADDGYSIRVLSVAIDPRPGYQHDHPRAVSKIIKDRSMTSGYFVVRSQRDDSWRFLSAGARIASKN